LGKKDREAIKVMGEEKGKREVERSAVEIKIIRIKSQG
jgi:hypothetical protein